MTLPAAVKIGWADYRLVEFEPDEHDDDYYGQTSHSSLSIKINVTKAPAQVVQTVLHEVLHGIAYVWELPKDKSEQEKWVSAMASGLLAVWRDNPELVRFIDEGVGRK